MSVQNALQVLAAAVAAWLLGAPWCSPMRFAKAWVAAHGYSDEQVKAMPKRWAAMVIDVGYQLAVFLLMGLIFGLWM